MKDAFATENALADDKYQISQHRELDQEHQVDEITDARIEPVAVVAGQSVKLLREVLRRRSHLDLGRREPVEGWKRTRHL